MFKFKYRHLGRKYMTIDSTYYAYDMIDHMISLLEFITFAARNFLVKYTQLHYVIISGSVSNMNMICLIIIISKVWYD